MADSTLTRFIYRRGAARETAGIPLGPNPNVQADHEDVTTLLLVATFCVYALYRTYPPGS